MKKITLFIIAVFVITSIFATPVYAQTVDNYNQPNNFNSMMGFGYGYGAGWLGVILMILFLALVIILIVVLARGLIGQNKKSSDDHGNSALDILKDRYAKGEIDKTEFEEKKKDLI